MPEDEPLPAVTVPRTIKAAVVIVRLEVLALAVGAIVLLIWTATHSATKLWAALTIVGFAALAAAVLWLCTRGLLALRPSAATPVILLELLALPVSYSLGLQAGRYVIAIPITVAALATLALMLSAPTRRALDRSI